MILGKGSKKYILVLCTILATIMLTACNSSKKTTTDDAGDVKWDTGDNVGEKWKEGQGQFISNGTVVESENGYYYKMMDSRGGFILLYYFDKASGKSSVVCDQANCKHNSDKCPAYLSQASNGLCYYNGYIYYTDKDQNQATHLFQMDYDGHNKKEIITLCNINEGQSIDLLQFHRDNLFYYVVGIDGISKLYRIDMVKNEKSLMYEKKEKGSLGNMRFLDNKVYYDISVIADDKTMTSTLYQYDIETGETKKIIDGEYSNSYTVTKDYIYYATNHNVNKYDIKSGKSSILMDDVKWGQLSNDGKHLYLDVDKNSKGEVIPRNIFVYDWNDNIIDTIQVDQGMSKFLCLFGDTDYLFFEDLKKQEIYYLDKTKIGTKDHELIKSEVVK